MSTNTNTHDVNEMKVWEVLNIADQVDGVKENLFLSLLWSFAASYINTKNRLEETQIVFTDNESEDETWVSAAKARNEEQIKRFEHRLEELEPLMQWAYSQANKDLLPTGFDIIQFFITPPANPRSVASKELEDAILDVYMETQGITDRNVALKRRKLSKEKFQERIQQQREWLKVHQDGMIKEMNSILGSPNYPNFELNDRDTMRILEKLASKCETYEQMRLEWADGTSRQRRLARLGAERAILIDAMNKADDLIENLQHDIENSGYDVIVAAPQDKESPEVH